MSTHTYRCPHCGGNEFLVHAEVDVPLTDHATEIGDIEYGEVNSHEFGMDSSMQCSLLDCRKTFDVREARLAAERQNARLTLEKPIPVEDWSLFDGVEIDPCVIDIAEDGEVCVERKTENDSRPADMWTVYLHCVAGGVESYVDCPTQDDAMERAEHIVAHHKELRKHGAGVIDFRTWPAARDHHGLDASFGYSDDQMLDYIALYLTARGRGTTQTPSAKARTDSMRVKRAKVALEAYAKTFASSYDPEDALVDMLTDCMHAEPAKFRAAVTTAELHYAAEVEVTKVPS